VSEKQIRAVKGTHDILPDSDTGTYFAAGVRLGSTLRVGPALTPEGR
jgi:hypothetical protein